MDQKQINKLIDQLNAPVEFDRLEALQKLQDLVESGVIAKPAAGRDVNNHIHSTYSFSPYSPSKAVWRAWDAGLSTAGIMDHDSISGALEFVAAGRILGLPTTIGAECRASFGATSLAGRRINNPDQENVAYIALHGVPHSQIDALDNFFKPIRKARGIRNRRMTAKLNELLAPAELLLDYDQDIMTLSLHNEGGEVTERHLLYAVALKLLERFGSGSELTGFLAEKLGIPVSEKAMNQLTDSSNPHIAYDLLGLLKSDLVEKFYIPADEEECPPIAEVVKFASEHGIVLAYPYLGDITSSVTGDKKAQTFEDSYLDELFTELKKLGFMAVTYMPSRNTREQLTRLKNLCEQNGFFQISGEDINQPRQAFICEAMRDPFFANLYDAAWALIGHELTATDDLDDGMFSSKTIAARPDLNERIEYYRDQAFERHNIGG
jgi:hypothetical protein